MGPHGAVQSSPTGVTVIGGVVVSKLYVGASEASSMMPIFFQIRPGDPESGQRSVVATLGREPIWKFMFIFEESEVLGIKMHVGITEGFEDRIIVFGMGTTWGPSDGFQCFGLPALVRAQAPDPPSSGDITIRQPYETFIRAHNSPKIDTFSPA